MARRKTGLRELAEKAGYTPGEFNVVRMAENIAQVKEWREYLEAGTPPPDMGDIGMSQAWKIYKREDAALRKEDRAMLEFFYPKMRASDDTVEHSGGLTVEIVKYGDGQTPE